MATRGGRISLPLAVGVDRGHLQWLDLFFFFFRRKSRQRGRWAAASAHQRGRWAAASGGIWVDLVG
jgi:hypothetical protein